MAMLSFDIRDLDSAAATVDAELRADDAVWQPGDPVPSGAIRVTGRLSATGSGGFYWHGHIAGAAVLPCRRCLTETRVPVQDEAHVVFAEAGGDAADDPDVYTFDARAQDIDLRPAVRELWMLDAPAFVLCRDDCKGLCPTCGADLNTGPCSCPPARDARWDALHRLDTSPTT